MQEIMGWADIACIWVRTYRQNGPAWLITLSVDGAHGSSGCTAYPQARAVVDEFGNLVAVKGWA